MKIRHVVNSVLFTIAFLALFYFLFFFGLVVHELGHYTIYTLLDVDSNIVINIEFKHIFPAFGGHIDVLHTEQNMEACKHYGFLIGVSGGLFGAIFSFITVKLTKCRILYFHTLWQVLYGLYEGFIAHIVYLNGNLCLLDMLPSGSIYLLLVSFVFIAVVANYKTEWFNEIVYLESITSE